MKRQLLVVAVVAAVVGASVGAAVVFTNRSQEEETASPKVPDPREVSVDVDTPGWATLGVASSKDDGAIEVPFVWADQARVCWDISGDLESLSIDLFGEEVSHGFKAKKVGSDCKYFHPSISHATATDCASVTAYATGDVEWALVVQQEIGPTYGLSGINSTRQYNLLENACTGEPLEPPPGFIECEDTSYAKSEEDCTWADEQFGPYQPEQDPEWTCVPGVGCEHPSGSFVPEGPQEAGSYCDRERCYIDV